MSINVNDGPLDSNKSQQKTLFGQFRGVVGGLGIGRTLEEQMMTISTKMKKKTMFIRFSRCFHAF